MEKHIFGAYRTEVDFSATKEWYKTADAWNCACEYCQNFQKVIEQKRLPIEILRELKVFEIPPEKATYVCEIYRKDEKFLYQFSYRIVGNIIEDVPAEKKQEAWGEMICCHSPYPYGAPGFPEPHFDLEFWADISWLLDNSSPKG